ncbi:hypothetical protein CPB83DRAFT_900849 [Crepidotus variabilis]|uniref:Uncharacterized protein n=1 Tax=Crepidotus variabilis TaxID=179855 RepID=A0A9P6E106_9AGAR|nr:hypothetical protein CPB83DRAFT_900849 [Crepidotus variabilis]
MEIKDAFSTLDEERIMRWANRLTSAAPPRCFYQRLALDVASEWIYANFGTLLKNIRELSLVREGRRPSAIMSVLCLMDTTSCTSLELKGETDMALALLRGLPTMSTFSFPNVSSLSLKLPPDFRHKTLARSLEMLPGLKELELNLFEFYLDLNPCSEPMLQVSSLTKLRIRASPHVLVDSTDLFLPIPNLTHLDLCVQSFFDGSILKELIRSAIRLSKGRLTVLQIQSEVTQAQEKLVEEGFRHWAPQYAEAMDAQVKGLLALDHISCFYVCAFFSSAVTEDFKDRLYHHWKKRVSRSMIDGLDGFVRLKESWVERRKNL